MAHHLASTDSLDSTPQASAHSSDEKQEADARVVNSELLLQGQRTLHITHNGSTYRLQATRLGKLILTK